MKAVIEFNLDDPDDAKKHETAVKSIQLSCAVSDFINQDLRSICKHGITPKELEGQPLDVIAAKMRDMLIERLEQYGVIHLI